jgi:hypothetical protein
MPAPRMLRWATTLACLAGAVAVSAPAAEAHSPRRDGWHRPPPSHWGPPPRRYHPPPRYHHLPRHYHGPRYYRPPPPVYYVPPPRVYYPPPVYAAPGFSFGFTVPLR